MAEYQIGEQEAKDQIDLFCEWYGIDLEEKSDAAEDEGIIAYALTHKALLKAFRLGRLEVQMREDKKGGETIVVVQHLAHPLNGGSLSEITYYEITGATKANVKIPKNATETAAMWASLAVAAKEPVEVFRGLRGADIGVAQLFGFLFLQV